MQGDSRSMDSTTGALVHSVYDHFTEQQHRLCVSYWKQLMHCCSEMNPREFITPPSPPPPIRYSIGSRQNDCAGACDRKGKLCTEAGHKQQCPFNTAAALCRLNEPVGAFDFDFNLGRFFFFTSFLIPENQFESSEKYVKELGVGLDHEWVWITITSRGSIEFSAIQT